MSENETRRERAIVIEEHESLRTLLACFRWDAPLADDDASATFPADRAESV